MKGKENCSRLKNEEQTGKTGKIKASGKEKEGKERIELSGEESTEKESQWKERRGDHLRLDKE